MHLIVQTYSLIELQQLRSELEKRGIRVHVSDEFTYAIPGMPGAEQPRGLWVALPEDIMPARQVVTDLVGAKRLEPNQATSEASPEPAHQQVGDTAPGPSRKAAGNVWLWVAFVAALAILWLLNSQT